MRSCLSTIFFTACCGLSSAACASAIPPPKPGAPMQPASVCLPTPGATPGEEDPAPCLMRAGLPAKAPFEEGRPVHPGYRVDTELDRSMLVGGATTFLAFYGPPAAIGAIVTAACGTDACRGSASALFIPVLGPLVLLGEADASATELLLLDSAGQLLGLGVFITALVLPSRVLIRKDQPEAKVHVTPRAGGGMVDVTVTF